MSIALRSTDYNHIVKYFTIHGPFSPAIILIANALTPWPSSVLMVSTDTQHLLLCTQPPQPSHSHGNAQRSSSDSMGSLFGAAGADVIEKMKNRKTVRALVADMTAANPKLAKVGRLLSSTHARAASTHCDVVLCAPVLPVISIIRFSNCHILST